jgi:hypothetical protein
MKLIKREFIYGCTAFFLPFSLNIFLINTIWTPTQGWYLEWANYMNQGLNPHTDFYLPFPPLFVWVNRIFLWTADPLIAERFFMTIAYSLLSLGLFKLLTRFFSLNIAIYTSLLSILIFQLSPTNTISGYYEFAILLATLLGMLLVIPLIMAYWFAPILVAFHDMPAIEAFKLSFQACFKNIGTFFVYSLISMALILGGMIPFGLGLLVVIPVMILSLYTSYKDIFNISTTPEQIIES